MQKGARFTGQEQVDIIDRWTVGLESAGKLAKEFGRSRTALYRMLQRNGIDTTKRQVFVTCSACGAETTRPRSRIREKKHLFCGADCYHAFLAAGNGKPYVASRIGQRIARNKVSMYFDLLPGHIVHHEDRNTLNNDLHNLRVFANQGDHVRHHRGFDVTIIWDGRTQKVSRKMK